VNPRVQNEIYVMGIMNSENSPTKTSIQGAAKHASRHN